MFGTVFRKLSLLERKRAFRKSINDDIMTKVQALISLDKVDDLGRPQGYELARALADIDLVKLNLKFFGYEVARALAAALPPNRETTARHVGLPGKGSTQADIESDWVAHWCGQLQIPVVFHRKIWELAYVLQAIYEHGYLREGARGLGFGCGQEAIPSYLAANGVAVTITDLAPEEAAKAGWAQTAQHATSLGQAFQPHLVPREQFDALVDLRFVDMNCIPDDLGGYDFCWSVCALEHLGTIARGLDFIRNSLRTIRPGGLSVHTFEFNIEPEGPTLDHGPTVLFQRAHLLALAEQLRAEGHDVAPLDFDLGDKPMDHFIDLPPFPHNVPPELAAWHGQTLHLKVAVGGFPATCFGMIVRKGGA